MRVFKKLNIALDHYNKTSKSFLFARDINTVKEYVIFDTIEEFMIHINKNTYNHYYEIIYGIQRNIFNSTQ